MRNRLTNIVWGIFFIIVGIGFVGNTLFGWNFELFFRGWWTLFIIIPSILSIIQHGPKPFSVSAFIIGVMLLLSNRGYFDYDLVQNLAVPVVFIVIGVCILVKALGFNFHTRETVTNKDGLIDYSAVFSGQNIIFNENELFTGASLNAIFGAVKLDLRSAIINEDAVIDSTAIFGGIDIFLPGDVNVKITGTPIFGGVSNKRMVTKDIPNAPTVFINGVAMFGGVDIK